MLRQAPEAGPPVEGLLDRVRAVVPLIAERAFDAEQRRKPDDDVIEALKATGAFRAFVPKRFGGYEIDLDLFVDVDINHDANYGVSVGAPQPWPGGEGARKMAVQTDLDWDKFIRLYVERVTKRHQ